MKTKTNSTDTIDRKRRAFREIMAAARHLSPSRMAWIAYEVTSGVDYSGSSKGLIAKHLVSGRRPIEHVVAMLRAQANTKHQTALREEDRALVVGWHDKLLADAKEEDRKAADYKRETGRDNFKHINGASRMRAKAARYRTALRQLDERSPLVSDERKVLASILEVEAALRSGVAAGEAAERLSKAAELLGQVIDRNEGGKR